MLEKEIFVKDIPLVELYGVNDSKMGMIKNHFPGVKVVARGEVLKVTGEDEDVNLFEKKDTLDAGSLSQASFTG